MKYMGRNKHILLVAIVLFSSMSMACVTKDDPVPDKNGSATVVAPGDSESNDRQTGPAVEIVLFHGTRRCTGCIVTGQLLDEVLQSIHAALQF